VLGARGGSGGGSDTDGDRWDHHGRGRTKVKRGKREKRGRRGNGHVRYEHLNEPVFVVEGMLGLGAGVAEALTPTAIDGIVIGREGAKGVEGKEGKE
jgi:hypothetical protein